MTDIVHYEPKAASAPSILDLEQDQMLARASKVSTVLADIIKKQGLASEIQGKYYIRIEGWNTMGTLLGFMPREAEVKELADGSFEATVEIYSPKTGAVVSRASALCGVDEKRWAKADRFARRSMAVTRATGKAYRLGFSWVMAMAGYEVTPAEDMPGFQGGIQANRGDPYDPKNEVHKQYMARTLQAKNLPRDSWKAISDAMAGKYEDELEGVIAAYLAHASEI